MDIHSGRQRPFPAVAIVTVLFLICIIPGQFWITNLFPGMFGFVEIHPSLVLLDIHIPLPVTIDLILVSGLFLLIYPVIVLFFPSRPGVSSWRQAMQRAGAVLAGLFALLFCMLSGGLIYYLVQDYLPRRIRNGIDSFGINADIHLSYPGYETIHLRGSLILLVCFVIGLSIFIRKIRKEPGVQKTRPLTREQRMTPYERIVKEKRMQEKQMKEIPMKEKQMLQEAGIKKKERKADKSWQPIEQATTRHDRNVQPRLCHIQPIMSLDLDAVNYMPMS